ncbi:glycosyltransferase family 2 protein [Enteroscipio rubneri]|uniref:glycosyltransferase family 2 protein n=1 Tax=Enteroscipio rubneri TaxID=2070686 RepID=UPI003AEF3240
MKESLGFDSLRTPALSIVIPIYNTEEEYLRPCFASVEGFTRLCQYGVQVVVVDDGSEPDYAKWLSDALRTYDFEYALYRKNNGGQNSARELGVQKASGEYLLFLDSDDRVAPDELDLVLRVAVEHRPGILCFNYDKVSPEGTLIERVSPWDGGICADVQTATLLSESNSLFRQLYRRHDLIESGVSFVKGTRLGEDMATAVALLLQIGNAFCIGAFPYVYVERASSVSHAVLAEYALDSIESASGMLAQIDKGNYVKFHDELELLCVDNVLFYGGVLAVKSIGGGKGTKEAFFDWMADNFPDWKHNPGIPKLTQERGAMFRLIITGHWRLAALLFKVRLAIH